MRRLLLGSALTVLALLAIPQSAPASRPDVGALEAQPCPPRYLPGGLRYPYEPADVVLAREQSLFRITDQYFELVPPIDWRQVGTDSQTFRFGLSSLNWTQILLEAYEAGDEGALVQAKGILLDFARNQRYGRAGTAPWAWGTKRTGDRATVLAFMARAGTCEGILTAAQQRALLRSIAEHGRFLLANPSPNNHGLFDGFALGVIAEQAPFMRQAKRWRRAARARFEDVFLGRIKPGEGFWLENSTRYHVAVMTVLELYLSLHLRRPQRLEDALPRMQDVCAWLIEPDGQEVQLGDTWLREAPQKCRTASTEQNGASTLTRSGAAFVRDGSSYLAQFAQFFNGTHKHSDDLSFELFEGEHRIVTDSGDYHRDKDGWRRFMKSARAHSTLTVDRDDFSRRDEDAYGSGIRASGELVAAGDAHWYAIHSRNPLLRSAGVDHRRTLLYRPGIALIVVDRVRSSSRHRYRRYFQFGPDLEPASPQAEMPAPLELETADGGVALTDASSAESSRTVVSGQLEPLLGWVSPTFRSAVPRPTAILETSGRNVDHAATISLDDSELRAELAGPLDRNGFTLTLEDANGPAGGLSVERDGDQIEIAETP